MAKIKQKKWNSEERRAFAESKLRAQCIPNKKRVKSREACRRRGEWS
jgi:hypothetical protein